MLQENCNYAKFALPNCTSLCSPLKQHLSGEAVFCRMQSTSRYWPHASMFTPIVDDCANTYKNPASVMLSGTAHAREMKLVSELQKRPTIDSRMCHQGQQCSFQAAILTAKYCSAISKALCTITSYHNTQTFHSTHFSGIVAQTAIQQYMPQGSDGTL